ncbi:MAG: hypothetical protein Q8P11_01925 [bacterium]|nr:hypothetical protein [bacterium]
MDEETNVDATMPADNSATTATPADDTAPANDDGNQTPATDGQATEGATE